MRNRWRRRWLCARVPLLAVLLAGLPLLVSAAPASAAGCGGPTPTGVSAQIAHAPTLSLETVTWELAQRGSPLSAADARFIVQASQQDAIDDAFALAVWAAETQDGREAVPGTHNIGNITAAQGVPWANHIFAIYPTWHAGIAAWFQLIKQLYIQGGHAQNLLTFALYYVHGLTPQQATPQMQRVVATGYVHTLSTIITQLQQHEAAIHPGQSTTEPTNGTNTASSSLFSLLPTGDLPPGWAGPGTWPAASAIRYQGCGVTAPPLVLAALQLGPYLRPDSAGTFDHWVLGAPVGVYNQGDITWDTDFLASVVARATGEPFPAYPTAAASWWIGTLSQQLGWTRVPAVPGQTPQAGDIVVLSDGAQGELALVAGVQLPQPRQPGFVLVLQAHAQHVLERWTLAADGALLPPWPFQTVTLGYLRPPSLPAAGTD